MHSLLVLSILVSVHLLFVLLSSYVVASSARRRNMYALPPANQPLSRPAGMQKPNFALLRMAWAFLALFLYRRSFGGTAARAGTVLEDSYCRICFGTCQSDVDWLPYAARHGARRARRPQ